MNAAVTIEGALELAADMPRLERAVAASLEGAGRAAAEDLANRGRPRVPFRSGAMSRSLVVRPLEGGAELRSDLVYYGPVEFGGWPRSRPYLPQGRYVGPLVATYDRAAEDRYGQAVSRAVNGFAWTRP